MVISSKVTIYDIVSETKLRLIPKAQLSGDFRYGFMMLGLEYSGYQNIQMDLIEAAEVNGEIEFEIYFKIVLPLALPVIATVGLFIGMIGQKALSFPATSIRIAISVISILLIMVLYPFS